MHRELIEQLLSWLSSVDDATLLRVRTSLEFDADDTNASIVSYEQSVIAAHVASN